MSPFSVPTGSSEWAVLYEFAQYCGGVCPRFDRAGRLVLEGWTEVENLAISDATPVTSLTVRDRRYGVLSQILVRDRVRQTVEQVEATDFLRMGGRCRRVMTMPGRSSYQAMRYSGQFQLDRSRRGAGPDGGGGAGPVLWKAGGPGAGTEVRLGPKWQLAGGGGLSTGGRGRGTDPAGAGGPRRCDMR